MSPEACEISASRQFVQPREVVFAAFMNPDLLASWWGPEGFENHFESFEPHPGGSWHLVMCGPDGSDYSMQMQFLEVVINQRLVLRHAQTNHNFVMTLDFHDDHGHTRLDWHLRFEAGERAESVRDRLLLANEENFDRLEARLNAQADKGPFVNQSK